MTNEKATGERRQRQREDSTGESRESLLLWNLNYFILITFYSFIVYFIRKSF